MAPVCYLPKPILSDQISFKFSLPFNVLHSLADAYPPVDQIVEQCGKFQLLERLLDKLLARKHKVHKCLIFV